MNERISQLVQFQRIKNPDSPVELVRVGVPGERRVNRRLKLTQLLRLPTEIFPGSRGLSAIPSLARQVLRGIWSGDAGAALRPVQGN